MQGHRVPVRPRHVKQESAASDRGALAGAFGGLGAVQRTRPIDAPRQVVQDPFRRRLADRANARLGVVQCDQTFCHLLCHRVNERGPAPQERLHGHSLEAEPVQRRSGDDGRSPRISGEKCHLTEYVARSEPRHRAQDIAPRHGRSYLRRSRREQEGEGPSIAFPHHETSRGERNGNDLACHDITLRVGERGEKGELVEGAPGTDRISHECDGW